MFDKSIQGLGVPTTFEYQHFMYTHRMVNGIRRSPPQAQTFGAEKQKQPIGRL